MTEITGKGYGDKHNWENKGTDQMADPRQRSTFWVCRDCHVMFRHYYHIIPDIHEAMKELDVSEECEKHDEDTMIPLNGLIKPKGSGTFKVINDNDKDKKMRSLTSSEIITLIKNEIQNMQLEAIGNRIPDINFIYLKATGILNYIIEYNEIKSISE